MSYIILILPPQRLSPPSWVRLPRLPRPPGPRRSPRSSRPQRRPPGDPWIKMDRFHPATERS